MKHHRNCAELPSVVILGIESNILVYFIFEYLIKSWTIYQILQTWAIFCLNSYLKPTVLKVFFRSVCLIYYRIKIREMAQTYCQLETRQSSSKSLFDTSSFDRLPNNIDCISHPKNNAFKRLNSRWALNNRIKHTEWLAYWHTPYIINAI